MTESPYRVELADRAQVSFDELSLEDRSKVIEQLASLAKDPFPGPANNVARLRTLPPSPTPRYVVRLGNLGILFTVEDDLVMVLVITDPAL